MLLAEEEIPADVGAALEVDAALEDAADVDGIGFVIALEIELDVGIVIFTEPPLKGIENFYVIN